MTGRWHPGDRVPGVPPGQLYQLGRREHLVPQLNKGLLFFEGLVHCKFDLADWFSTSQDTLEVMLSQLSRDNKKISPGYGIERNARPRRRYLPQPWPQLPPGVIKSKFAEYHHHPNKGSMMLISVWDYVCYKTASRCPSWWSLTLRWCRCAQNCLVWWLPIQPRRSLIQCCIFSPRGLTWWMVDGGWF